MPATKTTAQSAKPPIQPVQLERQQTAIFTGDAVIRSRCSTGDVVSLPEPFQSSITIKTAHHGRFIMMLTTQTLTLEAKQMGRRAALVPSWTVELPLESPVTLQHLLETIVQSEVHAYNTRQRDAKFVRALTEQDMADGAERGKIDPGGRDEDAPLADTLDAQREAIQAFKDGLYYVFLNDTQLERLEDAVDTSAPMRLLFLRLVALAGG